jgi:hypothetical protein
MKHLEASTQLEPIARSMVFKLHHTRTIILGARSQYVRVGAVRAANALKNTKPLATGVARLVKQN